MADTRNLVLKGQTWWFQTQVPRELRIFVAKSNIQFNLKTDSLRTAQRLRNSARVEADKILDRARAALPGRRARRETAHSLDTVAVSFREAIEQATSLEEAETASLVAIDEARSVEGQLGLEAAQRFAGIALGNRTPILLHLDQYLRELRVSENTRIERQAHIRRFDQWARNRSLEDATRKVAGRYVSEVLHSMRSGTRAKHLTSLRTYWKWLQKRGHLDVGADNPWQGQNDASQGADGDADEVRAFTDGEIIKLLGGLEEAAHIRDSLIILLLSGMRPKELVNLRVRDCSATELNIVGKVKTENSRRTVPVHSAMTPLIAKRLVGKRDDRLVMHEFEGLRSPHSSLSKQFTYRRRLLGVDDRPDGQGRSLVTLYSARRWFATTALDAGIQQYVVERCMGHKTTGVLLQHYARTTSMELLRECVEAVALPDGVPAP
jgi:integrase